MKNPKFGSFWFTCPVYDTKLLWGSSSGSQGGIITPLFLLIPDPHRAEVVVSVRVLSMGQIYLFEVMKCLSVLNDYEASFLYPYMIGDPNC